MVCNVIVIYNSNKKFIHWYFKRNSSAALLTRHKNLVDPNDLKTFMEKRHRGHEFMLQVARQQQEAFYWTVDVWAGGNVG